MRIEEDNASIVKRLLAASLAMCAAGVVCAQNYPARPLRMIVPWPPGGGADVIARVIFQKGGDQIGQQVIVDNRGGASTRTRAVNRVPACGM